MKKKKVQPAHRMTLEKWYGGSLYLPDYHSMRFPTFAASCIGLVRTIVKRRLDKDVFVIFNSEETASADQEKGIINISSEYLNGNMHGKKLKSSEALSFIMGIIVHEAGHFAYSPKTTDDWADYIKQNTTCSWDDHVARVLGNVIEDVFIEAELERDIPILCWSLDFMNDVFFTDAVVNARFLHVQGIQDAPNSMNEMPNLINYLIMAKVRGTKDESDWCKNLFGLVQSAANMPVLQDRLALALKVYDLLMANMPASECSKSPNSMGNDTPGGGMKSFDKPTKPVVNKDTIVVRVNRALDNTKNDQIYLRHNKDGAAAGGFDDQYSNLIIERNLDGQPGAFQVQTDMKYLALAEYARQNVTINRPYGQDMNRGNHIRRLSRIATDGRIFAEPVQMNDFKPMQVMLVVDCSLSMANGHRLSRALEAVCGCAEGLLEGQCDVSIYGHSYGCMALQEVDVMQIKNFSEDMAIAKQRMAVVGDRHGNWHRESRDGVAFEHLAQKFTNPSRRQIMIIISDGEPNSDNYRDHVGIRLTSESVGRIRQDGIEVLSISIDQSAVDPNNIIYGEENNVYNEDPNVMRDIVYKLFD